jgi:two-component system response regulator AtoC
MHLLTLTNDTALREELRATLGEDACEFHPSVLSDQELEQALVRSPDAILFDLTGQADDGSAFLQAFAKRGESMPLLVICQEANRAAGLKALREGAADYLLRPISMEELGTRLRRVQESEHTKKEAGALRIALERNAARTAFVAESDQMVRIRDRVAALAGGHQPLLFVGERGTGKKTLAEFLHRLDGQRRAPPAIISCAAVGDRLLDSRGWQEAQESGTAILEGIEKLPADQQERLATMLGGNGSKRPVRVIAVSSARLDDPYERRDFSPALFQRFESNLFILPPLRDRGNDVPALLAHFAQRTAQRLGRPVSVSPRALAMLAVYTWPGNVAELEASVERAALLGGSGRLEYADFGLVPGLAGPGETPSGGLELKPQVEAFERQVILQALSATKGNRQSAARLLGISLRTLFYKIKRYGVEA